MFKKKEFSQNELKDFFHYKMNEKELEKINKLELNDIISNIESPTLQIKYIDNVGYVSIGEGYLILSDSTEPTHYFAKIFVSQRKFKKYLQKEYNKR